MWIVAGVLAFEYSTNQIYFAIVGSACWVCEIAVESLKSHSIPSQKLSRNSGQVS